MSTITKRILHLTLHGDWFAAIAAGAKKLEYRNRTPYWRSRLEGRTYDVVRFRNGYSVDAPEMDVKFLGVRTYRKGRAGHYAIRLGRILKLKRWHPRRR